MTQRKRLQKAFSLLFVLCLVFSLAGGMSASAEMTLHTGASKEAVSEETNENSEKETEKANAGHAIIPVQTEGKTKTPGETAKEKDGRSTEAQGETAQEAGGCTTEAQGETAQPETAGESEPDDQTTEGDSGTDAWNQAPITEASAGRRGPQVQNSVITSLETLLKDGSGPVGDVEQWQVFRLNAKFNLPDLMVHEGDTTVITLPEKLKFNQTTEFDIKTGDGNVVAHAVIDGRAKTITLTYTDYTENHLDVSGSFFFYGGTSSLITKIYGEMETGALGCDMMLVAEPAFSLELKDAGYLEPIAIDNPDELLRFPYDEEGYWYPVRVCNMVLAYNPEMEAEWAAKGVTIPKTFKDFAADPALKGLISMGNPLTSGTTYAAVASLTQDDHYGKEFLEGLAANEVMIESGSTALTKLQTGECAAIMILEESVLKVLKEAADAGNPITNLKCIYPEDGVVLIPSTVMTVAEEHSKNVNIEACEAVEKWLLSEEAQKLILNGYMHSVFAGMKEIPYDSVDTDGLIEKDLGVDWENAFRNREAINTAWTEIVTTK